MFCIHWTWDALLYKTLMFWHFDWELFVHSLQEITISCSKRTVISDVIKMYCTNMEFCIWQTSFFCVAHVMEILKTVWGNGFSVASLPICFLLYISKAVTFPRIPTLCPGLASGLRICVFCATSTLYKYLIFLFIPYGFCKCFLLLVLLQHYKKKHLNDFLQG